MAKKGDIISNRWHLIDIIGHGGNSTVFKAREAERGVDVALKLITSEVKSGSSQYQRLSDEIATQKEFTDNSVKGIIPLIDFNLPGTPSVDDPIWIAMPIART